MKKCQHPYPHWLLSLSLDFCAEPSGFYFCASPSLKLGLAASSSPFGVAETPSIPGKVSARFLNSYLTFMPTLALVSIN